VTRSAFPWPISYGNEIAPQNGENGAIRAAGENGAETKNGVN
jgi:hypothetical protein